MKNIKYITKTKKWSGRYKEVCFEITHWTNIKDKENVMIIRIRRITKRVIKYY